MDTKNNSGFTLIELMVVISIIGLLASSILVSIRTSRLRTRDSRRVEDLNQLYKAMQLFYLDYGFYPSCNFPGYPGGCDKHTLATSGPDAGTYKDGDSTDDGIFMAFLAQYIGTKPKLDPLNLAPIYLYGYNGADNIYWDAATSTFKITANNSFPYPDSSSPERYHYIIGGCFENPTQEMLRLGLLPGTGCYVIGEQK